MAISLTMAEKVRGVLREHKSARNSDQELYKLYISMFHKDCYILDKGNMFVMVRDGIPQQQDLARCRRKIQEDGLYPATGEVRKKRMRNAKKVHADLDDIMHRNMADLKSSYSKILGA